MNGHAFNNPGQGNFSNNQQPNNGYVSNTQRFGGNSSHQNRVQPPAGYGSQGGNSQYPSNQTQQSSAAQPNQHPASVEKNDAERDYRMIAAYAKRSALQFKPTGTRVSDSRKFSHQTIMIEGAMRIDPNNPNNRQYNWGDKINVQVTVGELPLVIGVLLGIAPSCHFGNHGTQNDKAFNIEFQNDKYFVSVLQKGKSAVGVGVPLVDAMQIGHLALSQYLENFPGISSDTALRDISRLCNQLHQAGKFPLKGSN